MKKIAHLKTLLASAALVSLAFATSTAQAARGEDDGHYQRTSGKQHYNGCVEYRLSAYGGDGGFRLMSNVNDFKSTSNGSIVGKICANGRVKIELAKRNPGTRVALAINGREYVFGEGDRGNKVVNHWFRRYVTVDLPRASNNNSGSYSNYDNQPPQNGSHNGNYNNGYQDDYSAGHNSRYPVRQQNSNGHNNHGYQDQGYQNQGNQNHGYSNNHYSNEPKLYRSKSRKHRRAHKRGISHHHQGRYFAFQ